MKCVILVFSLLFWFIFCGFEGKSQDFEEVLLLDGADSLIHYGIDTTGNWWAITEPFKDRYRIYVNDFEGEVSEDISFPVVSPDGLQWNYYSIENGNVHFIYCDQDSVIHDDTLSATGIGESVYSPNGQWLAYTYFQGDNEIIELPFRTINVNNRSGNLFIDNSGSLYTILGKRGSKYVININGKESHSYDSIKPIGYWNDGTFIYGVYNGSGWEFYKNDEQIGYSYANIAEAQVNKAGTVMVALVKLASGRYMSLLMSDEYYDVVYGRTYDYAWGLALHPTDLLYGYGAINHNRNYVVQNNMEYYSTADIGNPFYSYNGDELIFIGRGEYEPYISVNGKLIYVKIGLYSDDIIAKKPKTASIAFKTNVALLVYFYEKDELLTSNMYDALSDPIYNRKSDSYEVLATIYNRLYLVRAKMND